MEGAQLDILDKLPEGDLEVLDKLSEGDAVTFSLTPKGDKMEVRVECSFRALCGIRIGAGQDYAQDTGDKEGFKGSGSKDRCISSAAISFSL